MAVRYTSVEFAFTGASEVSVRSMPGDASDSVLVGFSCLNNAGADRTVLVRHLVSGVYSGAYQEFIPDGEATKMFTPGCLGMDGSGQSIVATLNGSGTFRGQAIFRETHS